MGYNAMQDDDIVEDDDWRQYNEISCNVILMYVICYTI